MALSLEMMIGEAVDRSETYAERFALLIKPHAKGLAKFGILFFHILICILILCKFTHASLFIGYTLGIPGEEVPCLRNDTDFPMEEFKTIRTKNFDQCFARCREHNTDLSNSDDKKSPKCKSVTFTHNVKRKDDNCLLKDKYFREADLIEKVGHQTRNYNCVDGDESRRNAYPKKATTLMTLITLILLVTRVVSLFYVLRRKCILPACISLAFPLLVAIIVKLKTILLESSFRIAYVPHLVMDLSSVGCLLMVLADSMEEKDLHIVGLPSWGVNKKMSYITLIARMNVVFIFLAATFSYVIGYLYGRDGINYFSFIHIAILVPVVVSVVVGYKTKMMSIILATWLTLISLYDYPFYLHMWSKGLTFRFWVDVCSFGVNLSGVGSLIYIAILGAGAYSIDHVKRQ